MSDYKIGNIISGKWKLLGNENGDVLGRGGNSVVFKALDISNNTNQPIALKIIEKRSPRIENEIKIQKEFTQNGVPGVLPLIDYNLPEESTHENPIWIAMPIAETAKTKLEYANLEEQVGAILSIAKTLRNLINLKTGFLHRDIKPQNIFYYNNQWCLGDFGLVDYAEKQEITEKGDIIGSRHFIAPETTNDGRIASEKSEVYALAKSLYCLVVGTRFPIPGEHRTDSSHTTVANYIQHPKISQIDLLLENSTKTDSNKRFNLDSFIKELECWLDGSKLINYSPESQEGISEMIATISGLRTISEALNAKVKQDMQYIKSNIAPLCLQGIMNLKGFEGSECGGAIMDSYNINITPEERNKTRSPYGTSFGNGIMIRGKNFKNFVAGFGYMLVDDNCLLLISGIIFQDIDYPRTYQKFIRRKNIIIRSASEKVDIQLTINELRENIPKYLKEFLVFNNNH